MGRTPIFVRALTAEERSALTSGLRSREAFVLRRCQILLASASGKRASQIGVELGCDTDTALNAINAFNRAGLASLDGGVFAPQGRSREPSTRRKPSSYGRYSTRVLGTWDMKPVAGRWPWPPRPASSGASPRSVSAWKPCAWRCCDWACAGSGPSSGLPARIRHTCEKKAARLADCAGPSAPGDGLGVSRRDLVESRDTAKTERLGRGGPSLASG